MPELAASGCSAGRPAAAGKVESDAKVVGPGPPVGPLVGEVAGEGTVALDGAADPTRLDVEARTCGRADWLALAEGAGAECVGLGVGLGVGTGWTMTPHSPAG